MGGAENQASPVPVAKVVCGVRTVQVLPPCGGMWGGLCGLFLLPLAQCMLFLLLLVLLMSEAQAAHASRRAPASVEDLVAAIQDRHRTTWVTISNNARSAVHHQYLKSFMLHR